MMMPRVIELTSLPRSTATRDAETGTAVANGVRNVGELAEVWLLEVYVVVTAGVLLPREAE